MNPDPDLGIDSNCDSIVNILPFYGGKMCPHPPPAKKKTNQLCFNIDLERSVKIYSMHSKCSV